MFVFKAAVVGAGTMGGEIAQAIAAADVPVVLKDIKQEFVDDGLDKAREVTKGQLDRLVSKEKLTQEQADARLDEVMGHITGALDYADFGDVDFVIEAAPEKMEIKQSVFRELDAATPGHAILSSNTSSLSITEMADATLRPDKVVGFHFFYPASVMPLLEIVEGEDSSAETVAGRDQLRPGDPQAADHLRRGPGLRRQPDPQLRRRRALARPGGAGPLDPEDRRQGRREAAGADGPVHPHRPARARHGPPRRRAPERVLRRQLLRPRGPAEAGRRRASSAPSPAATASTRTASRRSRATASPTTTLVETFALKALVEACLLLEEGVAAARDIDLGMMAGAGLDPRRGLFPPFMKADLEGLDVVLEKLEKAEQDHGERFAAPTVLKRLVAQGRLGQKAGQGFYAYPQPDEGDQTDTVKLETRGDVAIAWLMNPPMNAISPKVIEDLGIVWDKVKAEAARSTRW